MTFEFIHDKKFRKLLERDYDEIEKCVSLKALKSALILCGSIIEAVLSDFLAENLPPAKSQNDILRASLSDLLIWAEDISLINKTEKNLGEIIKNYRNLIHPGREIRSGEEFDFDTVTLSKALLDMILKKVKNNYLAIFNYSSTDVIEKLISDWQFHSIYSIVITRLSHNEREKLLGELVRIEELYKSNYEHYKLMLDHDPRIELNELGNLEEIKDKVQSLKPLITKDVIVDFLKDLKNSVIKGEGLRALTLYNLFHEDLHMLSDPDQELIAIYMLSLFESIYENSQDLSHNKTFSTIGNYLNGSNGLSAFKKFSESRIVNAGRGELGEHEGEVYQQMFNSLQPKIQEKIRGYILDFIPKNREDLEIHNFYEFYDELVRRKIIEGKERIPKSL